MPYVLRLLSVQFGDMRVGCWQVYMVNLKQCVVQRATHLSGCQNYGPFLDPSCTAAPNIRAAKKGP